MAGPRHALTLNSKGQNLKNCPPSRSDRPYSPDPWPRPWPMTLTFNTLRAMVMTYSLAKVQGQRSVGSENRVETNGQTDGADCITSLANAVGKDGREAWFCTSIRLHVYSLFALICVVYLLNSMPTEGKTCWSLSGLTFHLSTCTSVSWEIPMPPTCPTGRQFTGELLGEYWQFLKRWLAYRHSCQ